MQKCIMSSFATKASNWLEEIVNFLEKLIFKNHKDKILEISFFAENEFAKLICLEKTYFRAIKNFVSNQKLTLIEYNFLLIIAVTFKMMMNKNCIFML